MRTLRVLPALSALLLALSACDSTEPRTPASLEIVAPAGAVAVGTEVQLTARVLDASGRELEGRPVEWSSSDEGVARVSATGLLTPVSPGQVTVTASVDGFSDALLLTVDPEPVAAVVVEPLAAPVRAGDVRVPVGSARNAAGEVLDGRSLTWSSSDTTVLRVSGQRFVAVAPGGATLTAQAEGVTGSRAVEVLPAAAAYDVTFLGTLGGTGGVALDVNANGQVVGHSRLADGQKRAFLWAGGTMTDLGTAFGWPSEANAINDAGVVVGGAAPPSQGCSRALVWGQAGMSVLFDRAPEDCAPGDGAVDVNDAGMILASQSGVGPVLVHEGSVVPVGSTFPRSAADLNGTGAVLLNDNGAAYPRGTAVWRPGGNVTVLPYQLGRYAYGLGLNDAGVAVGGGEVVAGTNAVHLLVWRGGAGPEVLPVYGPSAASLNEAGDVAVQTEELDPYLQSVLLRDGKIFALNPLVAGSGWWVLQVRGMNEQGQLVGEAENRATGQVGPVLLTPRSN